MISNCVDVSISIFTFHDCNKFHSSKFISILNSFLFFVFRNESFMPNSSIVICFEFRILFFSWISVRLNYRINNFFNFRVFLGNWIFYWAWLLIVKPKGSIFLSWISFISFLNSLFASSSSLCFVSYFAFTFFNSSCLKYSCTFHESEFCFISVTIVPILSTSLWYHWDSYSSAFVVWSSHARTRYHQRKMINKIHKIIVRMFFVFSFMFACKV